MALFADSPDVLRSIFPALADFDDVVRGQNDVLPSAHLAKLGRFLRAVFRALAVIFDLRYPAKGLPATAAFDFSEVRAAPFSVYQDRDAGCAAAFLLPFIDSSPSFFDVLSDVEQELDAFKLFGR